MTGVIERIKTLSPKVLASGAGAGGGAIIGTLILWVLGALLFGGSWSADADVATVAAVPRPVHDAILYGLAVIGALIAGYVKVDPDRNGPAESAPAEPDLGTVVIPGEVVPEPEPEPEPEPVDPMENDETTGVDPVDDDEATPAA